MVTAHSTVNVTNANESCILKMVQMQILSHIYMYVCVYIYIYICMYVTEIFKRKRLNYLPKSHSEKVAEVRGKATSV